MLAGGKQQNDTIRWCFRTITLVAGRRRSLSGEAGVREIRRTSSQPEKRGCFKAGGKEGGLTKILRREH